MTAINRPPAPRATTLEVCLRWNSPTRHMRTYPIARLNVPQSTLTVGEDSPLPGGEANGVGNLCPQTPLTKCGTAFTRKAPQNK